MRIYEYKLYTTPVLPLSFLTLVTCILFAQSRRAIHRGSSTRRLAVASGTNAASLVLTEAQHESHPSSPTSMLPSLSCLARTRARALIFSFHSSVFPLIFGKEDDRVTEATVRVFWGMFHLITVLVIIVLSYLFTINMPPLCPPGGGRARASFVCRTLDSSVSAGGM